MSGCSTASLRQLVSLMLVSGAAIAGEWHQSVSLPMTAEHHSNLLLTSPSSGRVTRAIVLPNYSAVGTFGVDELKTSLGVRFERSSNQSISANREDPNVFVGWQRQSETGGFGLLAKYDEASTRISELEESGLVLRDGTRKTRVVGGNWRAALDERSTLAANAEYKSTIYAGGSQTDFNNPSAGVTWNYSASEHIEPFVNAKASRYDPESATLAASNNYTMTAGATMKASDRLTWVAQVGGSRVVGSTSASGWVGSLVANYLGARYNLAFDAGRSVNARGEGGYYTVNHVKGTWGYDIADRRRIGLDASWQDNRGSPPNTMRQVGAWAAYELSPFWNARLFYQHKQRQQSGLSDASSDSLGLSFNYTHPDF